MTEQTTKLAATSKVNIAAMVMLVVALLKIWEVINPELFDKIDMTVGIIMPVLIIYFRTFRTKVANLKFWWQ